MRDRHRVWRGREVYLRPSAGALDEKRDRIVSLLGRDVRSLVSITVSYFLGVRRRRLFFTQPMSIPSTLEKKLVDAALLRGSFRLRSGSTSETYFDKYRFESDPLLLREIANRLVEILPEKFDHFAGLELGGVPIATMLSQLTGKPARFVRKKAKDYGTCLLAEGGEIRGQRLLVVEDVVTSGGQVVESVRALRAEGAVVKHVICVIDREAGGRANLAHEGLSLTALFRRSDLLR